MAHVRTDSLVPPKEWANHLRPYGKRVQNKAERRAARKRFFDFEELGLKLTDRYKDLEGIGIND